LPIFFTKKDCTNKLKILDKAKQSALELDEKTIASEIIELEKVIESQFITRSIDGRADDLIKNLRR
jgi:hypothetical protein